jgi:hypothetical protein
MAVLKVLSVHQLERKRLLPIPYNIINNQRGQVQKFVIIYSSCKILLLQDVARFHIVNS